MKRCKSSLKVWLPMALLMILLQAALPLAAATSKTEIVEETENKETKMFCSKRSEAEAKKECEAWLKEQRQYLGDRVLTVYCSSAEQATSTSGSCLYRSVGEIKYVLRKYRTETISE